MFRKTIWYLVFLCAVVESKMSLTLIGKSTALRKTHFPALETDRSVNSFFAVKHGETRTKEAKIIKRGIVLVDDDFDVPSAIYAHENKSGTDVSNRTDLSERNEGSGADVSAEKEIFKVTHQQPDNSSSSTQFTKAKPKVTDDTPISTDAENSGDGILTNATEYSTTEMVPKTDTELILPEIIPDVCMNSTCGDDLFISFSENRQTIAEGTNITLSCKANSSHVMMYWYKSNGTVYFLQTFGTEGELLFNIPDTKPVHSGIYKCVKWVNRQTCCNLESHLSVYELPLYKYHLIILGLIAAASLIICIFLSVRHTIKLKFYTKQFVEKHGTAKQLL